MGRWVLFAVGLMFIPPVIGAEIATTFNPKLKAIAACPALMAAAQTNHIPVGQFDATSTTNGLHPGDSATLLLTFVQKEKRTQYLLYVEAVAPDPKQKPAPKPQPFVIQSGYGPMKFESKPVAAKLRLLGPFTIAGSAKPSPVEEKDAQFYLNEDFLGLGLDRAAALLWRWNQPTNSQALIRSNTVPVKKPTADEERAVCASIPALFSYVDIVQHTEGLDRLFMKLVEFPSVWSMVKNVGMHVNLFFSDDPSASPANPVDWKVSAASPIYYFPWQMDLNDQPALKITLVVTRPQPPLLICGGVISLLAEKVSDEKTYMTMSIIGAQRN